jgi:hypothetical protein
MVSHLVRVGIACALAVLSVGCNQPAGVTTGAASEDGASQQQAVVTEHRFQALQSAKESGNPIGADCSEHGADACASRLCLHTTASRISGYVCSKACAGNESCPASWRCAHTYPSEDAAFCVPTNQHLPN